MAEKRHYGRNPSVAPRYTTDNYAQAVSRIERTVVDNRSLQAAQQGLSDMSAGPLTLQGKFPFDGAGEKVVDLIFPHHFMGEAPFLSFSAELKEGDVMVSGSMPTCSVVVAGWLTQEMPPHGRLYTGAKLAVVTTGVWYQKMMIHWTFTGTAISNPRYEA